MPHLPSLPTVLICAALTSLPDAAATTATAAGGVELEDCSVGGSTVRCGKLTVFEDREASKGRTIDLNIVVLPARDDDRFPDPIFFLHGGPGGAATDLAPMFGFSPLGQRRDIVLVDQRGTGDSNGLECPSKNLQEMFEGMATFVLPGVKKCMKEYDADLTLYTTTIAMADLDDVRAALGYDKINLFGGSYGTRAALEYMRRYPDRVRTAYLRGVHPPAGVLPANFDRDSQAALDALIADCNAKESCAAKHPGLPDKIAKVLARLKEKPEKVELTNPLTGKKGTVRVDDRIFRGLVHYTLYSSFMAAGLPSAIDEAAAGSVGQVMENVLQFAAQTEGAISFGMFLSVVCTEDVPFLDLEEIERDAEGTLLGGMMSRGIKESCAQWPRAELAEDYKQPVKSNAPTLIVSGAVDPVTAPHLAAEAARHLPNSLHLVAAGTSHGNWTPGCVSGLLETFLDNASVEGLDSSCIVDVERPGFRD